MASCCSPHTPHTGRGVAGQLGAPQQHRRPLAKLCGSSQSMLPATLPRAWPMRHPVAPPAPWGAPPTTVAAELGGLAAGLTQIVSQTPIWLICGALEAPPGGGAANYSSAAQCSVRSAQPATVCDSLQLSAADCLCPANCCWCAQSEPPMALTALRRLHSSGAANGKSQIARRPRSPIDWPRRLLSAAVELERGAHTPLGRSVVDAGGGPKFCPSAGRH